MKKYWTFAVAQWDRVIGWALVGAGGLLTLVGALSVSSAEHDLDQLSYLASGPAVGLFLLGVGAILILTADLRDEWAKLDEVATLLRDTPPAGGGREISLPDGPSALRASLPVLAVAGLGTLIGAAGVNQSGVRDSAVRWSQLSVASLTVTFAAVALFYRKARRAVVGGVSLVLGPGSASVQPAEEGQWYTVEGSQRYHRAGCDLLRFSEVRPIPAEGHDGLVRCPICR